LLEQKNRMQVSSVSADMLVSDSTAALVSALRARASK
jgi:hypothetical protein